MANNKKIRLAINGFGRIGRAAFKVALDSRNIEVVAVNDLVDTATMAHLLRHDTVFGNYEKKVSFSKDSLTVGGKKVKVFGEAEPAKLPWKKMEVDVVIESTGRFREKKLAMGHIKAGAKRVVISANGKGKDIKILILGVNEHQYNPKKDIIVSNGSCTTNCLLPVFKVLNDEFGVTKGMMATVHSYTSSQSLIDGPRKDLREARAAAENIIPAETGATDSIIDIYPKMKGKIAGLAFRVPTIDVSVLDLTVETIKKVNVKKINSAFKKHAVKKLKNIMAVSEEPLVSSDYTKNPHSATVDLPLTMVEGNNLVKVIAWYDNEWGYSNRLVEMAEFVAKGIQD